MPFTLFEEQRTPLNGQSLSFFSFLFNCTHYSALWFFANWINCMNCPTCCSTVVFVISTPSPFVLNWKANNGYFMSTTLYRLPFFLHYVYKESGTSTDDFSVKEAKFNLKLAKCMQNTCDNLNPRFHKNRSYAQICDFYWRLSHIFCHLVWLACTSM